MRDRLFSYKFPFHYGWVLVGLLFVALINFGLRGALGAYFISWENEFLISVPPAAIPAGLITFAVAQPLAESLPIVRGTDYIRPGLPFVGAHMALPLPGFGS